MRVFSILLVVAATIVIASASAQSESKQRLDISPAAPQWRTITENEVPTKRNLRKKEIESEEERAIPAISLFDDVIKAKGLQVLPYANLANLEDKVKTQYLKLLVNNLNRKQIVEITDQVPHFVLKHGDTKAGRLVQYNAWIWNSLKKPVDPDWVLVNYPAFFKGYERFFNNRFTRGYKYA